MKVYCAILLALACGASGCGSSKPDNSKIQSPNDQPIGGPKAIGAANPPQAGVTVKQLKENGKALPKFEIKP